MSLTKDEVIELGCPICTLHVEGSKDLVRETSSWYVRLKNPTNVPGYHIIEPKRHITKWGEFSPEEIVEMGELIKALENQLIEQHNAEKVYTVTISEMVPHLHLHIIPRTKDSQISGLSLIEKAIT
ncbi:diadenosine tetraphosphate (Ap4A) HIT family hydrolase [Paenibacillus mucilaginosus]|uniref:HIT family protein n=1 Tax=Paenibacillus mucilaginosus TaxID=61624 RepID=UPI003D21D1DE